MGVGRWQHSPVESHHGELCANENKPVSTTHGATEKSHGLGDRVQGAGHKEPRDAIALT